MAYEAEECSGFEKRTVIDPRNQFPIPYSEIATHLSNGECELLGSLPDDFREKLIEAVKASRVIERNKKNRLLSQLE